MIYDSDKINIECDSMRAYSAALSQTEQELDNAIKALKIIKARDFDEIAVVLTGCRESLFRQATGMMRLSDALTKISFVYRKTEQSNICEGKGKACIPIGQISIVVPDVIRDLFR